MFGVRVTTGSGGQSPWHGRLRVILPQRHWAWTTMSITGLWIIYMHQTYCWDLLQGCQDPCHIYTEISIAAPIYFYPHLQFDIGTFMISVWLISLTFSEHQTFLRSDSYVPCLWGCSTCNTCTPHVAKIKFEDTVISVEKEIYFCVDNPRWGLRKMTLPGRW